MLSPGIRDCRDCRESQRRKTGPGASPQMPAENHPSQCEAERGQVRSLAPVARKIGARESWRVLHATRTGLCQSSPKEKLFLSFLGCAFCGLPLNRFSARDPFPREKSSRGHLFRERCPGSMNESDATGVRLAHIGGRCSNQSHSGSANTPCEKISGMELGPRTNQRLSSRTMSRS